MAEFDSALSKQEEEKQEEETKTEDVKDEPGTKEVEEETKKEEPKEEKKDDNPQVPLQALMAERDKAKELKREIESVRKELDEFKQSKAEENQVSYDEDPEAYLNQRDQKMLNSLREKFYDMSVLYAKKAYPDYDEKEALFVEEAKKDPTLAQKMEAAPDPASFVYETAQNLEYRRKYGDDPSEWKKALRKEIMEELEAEKTGSKKDLEKAAAKQPTNLNDLRAASGNEKPGYKPASFRDALPK